MLVLINRFDPLLDYAAYKYSRGLKLYSREDVYQECRLAFITCVLEFNLDKFRWFNLGRWAKICVKNHACRLWRLDAHIKVPRCDPEKQKEVARGMRRVTQFSQIDQRRRALGKIVQAETLIIDKRRLSPVEQIERNEEINSLLAAIESLTGWQTSVVNQVLSGASYAEIGRDNGITRQAVENCYKRSLKAIKDRLCVLGLYESKENEQSMLTNQPRHL